MILGIDASNLRRGGGITHLVELLRVADPTKHGFTNVVLWSGRSTLDKVEDRSWLRKCHLPVLDGQLVRRVSWQRFALSGEARRENCDLLFVPGGAYAGDFRPIVTMSRNLLPFQWSELRRFGFSPMTLKLLLLRLVQARNFRRATGVIFLTSYARDAVEAVTGGLSGATAIIPHGLDQRFIASAREARPITEYSPTRPFRILYVSIVDVYKHQWHVAEAIGILRRAGLPVVLQLAGPSYPPAMKRLQRTLESVDPTQEFVHYLGEVPYGQLPKLYSEADLCVFASSCENMPNILLEAMGSGVAVACARRGPMPEVLGDAGVYFDPEDPPDIARALQGLIESTEKRTNHAARCVDAALAYSWRRCAEATFAFLASTAARASASLRRTKP